MVQEGVCYYGIGRFVSWPGVGCAFSGGGGVVLYWYGRGSVQ